MQRVAYEPVDNMCKIRAVKVYNVVTLGSRDAYFSAMQERQ